jgi:glycine oxidase
MGAYIGTVGTSHFDTVVVGGGIIGLATAFVLANDGQLVALVDDAIGLGATRAAAGMLAPSAESAPEHSFFAQRALEARRAWPDFLARVNQHGFTSSELTISGTAFVGWDSDDRQEWRRYFDAAQTQGIQSVSSFRENSPALFEGLTPRVEEAQFVDSDAFVDPDDIVQSLLRAAAALGVTTFASRAVHCAVKDGDAITEIAGETIRSSCGVMATGFQNEPLSIQHSSVHRLRPVRGVTVRLQAKSTTLVPMVRAYIHGRHVYVVRRSDGSVLIGASSDESADLVVEAGAVRRLLDDAVAIMPGLDEASFGEARVGLRPASSQQIPFFDVIGDGAWAWSGGHYRHGFLMAPLAANDALNFTATRLR